MARSHRGRRLAGAGLFIAGLAAGAALAPVVGAAGPLGGPMPDAGAAPGVIEVQADVAALEARLSRLEGQIGLVGSAADVPDGSGALVRAPFTVLGSDGQPLLTVTDEGGAGQLVLGAGQTSVRLQTEDANAFLMTNSSKGSSVFGMSDIGFGLYLNSASGEPMAEIAEASGRGMAFRAYDGGQQVAAIGNIPGEGGSVRIYAPGAPRAAATLNTNSDGSGRVEVWSSSGEKAASLDGGKRLVTVQAEAGAIQIGQGSSTWGVFLKDKSGQPAADLSQPSGRGMGLRVYENGDQVAGIGQAVGQGGTVRVFASGQGGSSGAELSAKADGSGVVLANGPGGKPAVELNGERRFAGVFNQAETLVSFLAIGSDGSGGNITTANSSGQGVFSAGSAGDGGGEACVSRTENGLTCLGIGLPMR